MAITSSARLGLTVWGAGADPFTRAHRNADNAALDDAVAIDAQGLAAARPAAGTRGSYYYATDDGILYRDTGAGWVGLATFTAGTEELRLGESARNGDGFFDTARLSVSADGAGTLPVAVQTGAGAATDDPAIKLVDTVGIELTVIDADGALRTGRNTAGVVPRSGFVTIRGTDPTERVLVIDADGPGGLTEHLIHATTQGTRRFTVDALGRVYLSSLSDNAAPPTTGGAGVLFCDNVGRLKYRGTGGTITTLAPA